MRLTTLEIKGFKSFGDKVTMHFDKGVTSVVGPNGSGKSNVVDAIRWVLGEQKTRMLRSEKMENIIFNGTKTRKASNLAEVSMTFENTKNILPTEYSTVTITRKLYRSGESEYFLNNVPCRLKDITDLFLDTGIGPDSYAIIELKMVDDILNDKNNSIKLLFEEAAGISKYKIRKKQTFARLEETEADLNRVNDLLFEIERNMKLLESQAKKTERYYKIKEQYKELSTELAILQLAGSKIKFEELQKQEEDQHDDKVKVEAQISELEASVQQEKLDTLNKEKELAAAQKELNEKISTIQQYENDKKVSNEKLKYLQDKESSLTNQLNTDKATLIQTQDGVKLLEEDKFNEERVLQDAANRLEELRMVVEETRNRHVKMQAEINHLAQQAQAIQVSTHDAEKNHAVAQAKKESLQKEIERLSFDAVTKEQELEETRIKLSETADAKEKLEKDFTALTGTEEVLTVKNKLDDEELKKVTEEIIDVARKLDSKKNEYNLTKSLIDNLEGYPESLRFLKKSGTVANQALLLSDVITCKQEYKTAIENYLESYMNYFVIDNVEEASRAINLLSETSKGRANFFLLSEFRNPQAPNPVSMSNCIHALQIIETDSKYLPLINHLLHDVYIVTGDQDATPHLQSQNPDSIFISQNGKYCKTRHALSGGSVGLFDGKRIGRAKNLEALSVEIEELQLSLEAITTKRDGIQKSLKENKAEQERITASRNALQKELSNATGLLSSLQSKTEQFASIISNNQRVVADLQGQLTAIDNYRQHESVTFDDHVKELRSQYESVSTSLSALQIEFTALNETLNNQNSDFNKQNIEYVQQQNKIANLIRDINYKHGLLETLQKNIENNTLDLEIVQQQTMELVGSSADFDAQLQTFYGEKEILDQNVTAVEADYFRMRGEIDEVENNIRQLRQRKENCDALLQAVKDQVSEIKLMLNSMKERLSVEFNINIEEILDRDPSPDWTEEGLREKVNKQKNQLDNYGPINPMAVEAYNEIKERHDFIIAQQLDLANAKASLLQTIAEIDTLAKEKFMEAFTAIRENFIKVFRSLFTNDDACDLILANPENPIESDINVIAQPKGKRPLSISQLSGGEKTLTATALLFGIYLLKPAPFCIFDEVDAPLDDGNIDKFNKIIKAFSNESQFIIITHNKRTMAATDIIYGITMIEQGVTQVVPVDLAEMVE